MLDPEDTLTRIRARKPLVHHITNWVTIYDCALITRAVGALPVMAHAVEEAADMTSIAAALVLNIGTLTSELVQSMILSGRAAVDKGLPIVLDAVGAGATPMRTYKSKEILDAVRVSILKGNQGEIATLAGISAEVKGVESISIQGKIEEIAIDLAQRRSATVVVTGAEDIITDGRRLWAIRNGHELMGQVVGTGCMISSVIAAFAAVSDDITRAAAEAVLYYDIAGELCARRAGGPGSFRHLFFDQIRNTDPEEIRARQQVRFHER